MGPLRNEPEPLLDVSKGNSKYKDPSPLPSQIQAQYFESEAFNTEHK